MITPNNDWCFDLSVSDHALKGQTRAMAIVLPNPTDPRRQALKRDFVLRHVQPVVQMRIVCEQFFDLLIGLTDVLWLVT